MDQALTSTLIGGVVGFVGALLPEVFGLVRDLIASRTGTVGTNGNVWAEGEQGGFYGGGAVYEEGSGPEQQAEIPLSFRLLDFMRASVRPVITYGFFALFIYIKLIVLWSSMADGVKAAELLPILWDEGTETLFAAIMAFWFGSRMMVRYRRRA